MKSYFSHYIFIYPNIYLKNSIIQLSLEGYIMDIIPFEKEIPNTEFYSGLLLLIPKCLNTNILLLTQEVNNLILSNNTIYTEYSDFHIDIYSDKYSVYYDNQIIL